MKGQIFISGGGDIPETKELDRKYFSLLKNNSKILYIPVAMGVDLIGYEGCYDWFSSLIGTYCNDKDVDFTMLLEDDEIPEFSGFDAIYIGGGNTFALLNYVKKRGLNEKFIEYIDNGGIIYGGSAGAIIFGKDIRTVEEENNEDYQYHSGMNLFNDYSIICHYEENLDSKIFETLNKIKTPILALPENAGLILKNNEIEIIGDVYIFNENKKVLLSQEHLSV
jgi:dipeptidase E